MKILIVSDSHGRHTYLDRIVEKVAPIDLLLHLGDLEGGEEHIRQIAPCQVEMVSGNNDYFTTIEREKVIEIGKYRVFMTHGHRYHVYYELETIREAAAQRFADIVMFGHTHIPLLDQSLGITVINPGSISQPRQEGRKPSYIIMEIDQKGEAHYTINYAK